MSSNLKIYRVSFIIFSVRMEVIRVPNEIGAQFHFEAGDIVFFSVLIVDRNSSKIIEAKAVIFQGEDLKTP